MKGWKLKLKITNRLLRIVNRIEDKELRQKIIDLLQNHTIIIGGISFEGLPLETSPASKKLHHSYPKGLVQHIETVTTISIALSDVIEKTYRTEVNRDIVLAAALLHDIMKPFTYTQEGETYGTSQLGERIDHLSLAVSELVRRGFPLEIIHAVAAHHGKAGPMNPRTIEALICSLADGTDASLNGDTLEAARYLVYNCIGENSVKLSAEEAFRIVHAKQIKGCAGVVEVYKKVKTQRSKKA